MSYAFFDTCSHHPDPTNTRFVLGEKMAIVRKKVSRILAKADELDAPVLSTTCLGLMRGDPSMSVADTTAALDRQATPARPSNTAYVTRNATPGEVAHALTRRRIIFERLGCRTPEENVRRKTFDAFGVNPNVTRVVRALGERHWLVFGAGFEHCVLSTVEGFRSLGLPVTVLADGCIHGGISVPVTFLETYERIRDLGAGWATLDTIFAETKAA